MLGACDGTGPSKWLPNDRDRDRGMHGSDCAWDRCRDSDDGAARRAGGGVIAVPAGVRVLVATKPVDCLFSHNSTKSLPPASDKALKLPEITFNNLPTSRNGRVR